MSAGGNLFAQQEANRKASRRLVAGFIIFIAWLGFGGDCGDVVTDSIAYTYTSSASAATSYGICPREAPLMPTAGARPTFSRASAFCSR